MAGYNEQLSDGSWQYVTQNPDGSYNRTPIPPSGYAAANIPGGSGGGSSVGPGNPYQNADGTWSAPNVPGSFPSQQAAQNAIITAQGNGGNQSLFGGTLLTTQEKLDWLDSQNGGPGTWKGDRSPAGVEAAYAAASQGGGGGGSEAFNPAYNAQIQQGIDNTVKNALAAGGLTLQAAKDAADNIRSLIQTYGDQAYQYLAKAGELGVSVADVMSRLTGPANAFAYDRAANAFRGNGLGDSVQALQSGFKAPSFGALGATSPMTFASLGNDVAGNQGSNGTGTGGSIIDQLLGLAGTAEQGYQNAANGNVPFSIPQFDANGKLIPGTGSTNNQTAVTAPGGGSDGLYQTSNGPKTVAQMLAELDTAAGGQWKDGDRNSATAIASAYAHTTGGTVTPPQTATASTAAANSASQATAPATTTNSASTTANPLALSAKGDTGAATSFQAPTTGAAGGGDTGSDPRRPNYLDQYSPDAQKYLLSLPDPSQVNARNYAAEDQSTQALQKAGYSAKGYDPVQLDAMWSNMLPKFKAPEFGLVS